MLFIIISAVALAVIVAFVLQPDPSVEWSSFQSRLRETFERARYTTVNEASCSSQQVPLPFSIRWHPRHWHPEPASIVEIGFPNGAEYYTVTHDGSSLLDCYVRYLDGRACLIDIRSRTAPKSAAMTLRSTLTQQFPGLPIHVTGQ